MSEHQQHHPDPRENEERSQTDVVPLHRAVMRELDDPRDGFAPTPVWLLFSFFLLIAWGGSYIGQHNGGWSSNIYDEDPRALGKADTKAEPIDPMVLGARTFNYCTQCHQADAKGVAGTYPPLAGSEWVTGREDVLVRILLNGLNGPIQVKGSAYGGEMPPWSRLNDNQLAAVATYIRKSFGNDAAPVDSATVAKIREQTTARTNPWTEADLKNLPDSK